MTGIVLVAVGLCFCSSFPNNQLNSPILLLLFHRADFLSFPIIPAILAKYFKLHAVLAYWADTFIHKKRQTMQVI